MDNILPDERLSMYAEMMKERAQASEVLIPSAVKLRELDEWKAAKLLIEWKIGMNLAEMGNKKYTNVSDCTFDQGFIQGFAYAIRFIEQDIVTAMEKKKEAMAKRAAAIDDKVK